jgi:hypothetical protein
MLTNEFLRSPAGQAAIAYAEEFYSETFKAETFTLADNPSMFEELVAYHMEPIYKPEPKREHRYSDDDDDCVYDFCIDPEILHEGLSREEAENMAKTSTYVWLVTYKGEGEGFILADLAQNLRQFHGKWDYS